MVRKIGVVSFSAAAALLLAAAAAWACTNLATLNLSQSNGPPGTGINVTGSSFKAFAEGGQPVLIHWNAEDGKVLAKAKPDASGNIAAAIKIPADATPGYYVLVATQQAKNDEGKLEPAYGTPARASFLVGTGSAARAQQPSAAPAAAVAPEGTPTGLIALTILLALIGIGLFGAGVGLFIREVRRRAVPAPVRKE